MIRSRSHMERYCGLPNGPALLRFAGMSSSWSGKRVKSGLVLLLLLGVVLGIWKWLAREKPRYEAAFAECIWVTFPPGYAVDGDRFGGGKRIDEILRERKVGFLGGVAGVGDPPEVVEVELTVDLDQLEARALIEELQAIGLLPKEATYQAGRYPRPWPEK